MNKSEKINFLSRSVLACVSLDKVSLILNELKVQEKFYTDKLEVITEAHELKENSIQFTKLDSIFSSSWDVFLFNYFEKQLISILLKYTDSKTVFALPNERSDRAFDYIYLKENKIYDVEIIENDDSTNFRLFNLKLRLNKDD